LRDLHAKTKRPQAAARNRVKKAPKKRKPINWRPIFTWLSRGIGAAALCVALAWGSVRAYRVTSRATSGWLRLETIEVTPLKRVTRAEVLALAGVKPGDPMLGLKLRTIMGQLAKNPWIEQVQVRRYFPHTLAITLTERAPAAVANVGCLYYLDAKGKLFKSLADGDRLDYPLITGITEEDLEKDPDGAREALKGALALIANLKDGRIFSLDEVSEIHYDKGYGFTLFTMQRGVPVKVGNDGFQEKLARLSGIYPQLKAQMQNLDYIDLDYADRIIVKKG